MSLKIVFAGTPQFSVPTLQALLESSHRVIAIYTQPDRPAGRGCVMRESEVKLLGKKQGIPIEQPFSLRDSVVQQKLIETAADLMVVVAYGLLLPKAVLKGFRLGCVNVHASLLPRWRGAAPIQHAILAGDVETGVSIMQMDKGLDTGDVLAKKSLTINPEDTAANLHDSLSQLGASLLVETLNRLEKNILTPEKQDDSKATYASKIQKEDGRLNWSKSADELARCVRAFNPTPVAFAFYNDQPFRIWKAEAIDEATILNPGSLVRAEKRGIDIATGKGVLRLHQIQLPGKRIQSANDFINAYRRRLVPKETIFN